MDRDILSPTIKYICEFGSCVFLLLCSVATVGFEQPSYTVLENASSIEVCLSVMPEDSTLSLFGNLVTMQGSAQGIQSQGSALTDNMISNCMHACIICVSQNKQLSYMQFHIIMLE